MWGARETNSVVLLPDTHTHSLTLVRSLMCCIALLSCIKTSALVLFAAHLKLRLPLPRFDRERQPFLTYTMIYIDFHCDKSDVERWRRWCREHNIDDEPECRTGYITRGSGVMDYYFRLLCIAAYRQISSSSQVRVTDIARC